MFSVSQKELSPLNYRKTSLFGVQEDLKRVSCNMCMLRVYFESLRKVSKIFHC